MQWHLERPAAKQQNWEEGIIAGMRMVEKRKENGSERHGWQWEKSETDGKGMKEKTLRGAVQSLCR